MRLGLGQGVSQGRRASCSPGFESWALTRCRQSCGLHRKAALTGLPFCAALRFKSLVVFYKRCRSVKEALGSAPLWAPSGLPEVTTALTHHSFFLCH